MTSSRWVRLLRCDECSVLNVMDPVNRPVRNYGAHHRDRRGQRQASEGAVS